ncbi:MAG: DUF5615 family PIN-like protein [Chloroflexota bacterium]
MKFLVDAQLPKKLAYFLKDEGYDAIHTRDLPLGNGTPDSVINDISLSEQRIVITKDSDFRDSYLLSNRPYKLLLISTGNIKNSDLMKLFEQNLEPIINALEVYGYVELDRLNLTIHG